MELVKQLVLPLVVWHIEIQTWLKYLQSIVLMVKSVGLVGLYQVDINL